MPSIYILSAMAALVAVIGFLVAKRVFKPIDLDTHQYFLDAMLSIVGTLVSILLGLLVAASLDHYRALEQSIDMEAADLSEVYRLSTGLPEEERGKIRALCVDYSQAVLEDEWPALSHGHWSNKVLIIYAKLVSTIATFKPHDDGETNIHAALINSVQQVGDCRRQRILSLGDAWTKQLMPVLVICSVIVLVFAYLYVRKGSLFHGLLIGLVAIALGGNLGLVYLLNNPFAGDWKIQPKGFQLNAKLLQQLHDSKELQHILQPGSGEQKPAD